MTDHIVACREAKLAHYAVNGVLKPTTRMVCDLYGVAAARTGMTTAEKAMLAAGSTFTETDTGLVYLYNQEGDSWTQFPPASS